jgi:hypothetical protein
MPKKPTKPTKPTKPKSARGKQEVSGAASGQSLARMSEADMELEMIAPGFAEAAAGIRKFQKSIERKTSFLLRLPPDLRSALESFKDESGSKSLQNLILQLLAEGLARKADFRVAELFARDLHVSSLAATVGSAPDLIIGNRRVEIVGTTTNNFEIDQAALLEAHQRVLLELENQKLTSFASIMDPALLSYRLLIDYASQDPASRDRNGIIRDFSNGLKLSAIQAMNRGKWSFAESLLLQAAASDPSNLEVNNEAGIYLLRRLVRRWYRPDDSMTSGVSSQYLMWADWGAQRNDQVFPDDEDRADETAWATALKAWNLLVNNDGLEIVDPWYMRWISHSSPEMTRGNWRIEVWKRLATIVVCTSSPDRDDLKLLHGSNIHRPEFSEETLIGEIIKLFGAWERGFRMTREISQLQKEWSQWFEPLEVLWWLGYRREAFALARDARGFVAEGPVEDRMALIRRWNPEFENVESYELSNGRTYDRVMIYERELDENEIPVELEYPVALLNRPMSI